jgi:hypothetical protein
MQITERRYYTQDEYLALEELAEYNKVSFEVVEIEKDN